MFDVEPESTWLGFRTFSCPPIAKESLEQDITTMNFSRTLLLSRKNCLNDIINHFTNSFSLDKCACARSANEQSDVPCNNRQNFYILNKYSGFPLLFHIEHIVSFENVRGTTCLDLQSLAFLASHDLLLLLLHCLNKIFPYIP